MPLRTVEQYKDSLKDDRQVYFRGQRIPDVTGHPLVQTAIEHEATDYRLMHDPQYRDLAVVRNPETGEEMSRYFLPPQNAEQLLKRSELIETACREGGTLVVLAKVVGSDALFGLLRTSRKIDKACGTSYYQRVKAFYDYCCTEDVSFALAQTDTKGDRALRPSEQEDPDSYLRIVEERDDGIVVRGAKVPHLKYHPRQRDDCPAHAGHGRRGQGLRGRLCHPAGYPGAQTVDERLWLVHAAQQLRSSGQFGRENDRNADHF